jgi:hypothetical protein
VPESPKREEAGEDPKSQQKGKYLAQVPPKKSREQKLSRRGKGHDGPKIPGRKKEGQKNKGGGGPGPVSGKSPSSNG